MRFLAYTWATWFGSGFMPLAPGTAGSLASLPIVWFFALQGTVPLFLFVIFTFVSGVVVSNFVSKDKSDGDPQIVVIDEVCGQAITLLLIPVSELNPFSLNGWIIVFLSFGLFRLFDVWKPWPASYFDKKVHNGWGMMLDDVAAGIYAMICVSAIVQGFGLIF